MDPIKHMLAKPVPYALGIWGGLWLPDIDLLLLPILHHRSIITHSVLIPWLLFLFFKNRVPLYGIAGLYVGISIHLAADCLSATVGFGMICNIATGTREKALDCCRDVFSRIGIFSTKRNGNVTVRGF